MLATGANEVVRTFSWREWGNIEHGCPYTRTTQVKLAGNKWHGAGMTAKGGIHDCPNPTDRHHARGW